uniref:Uncharacterized protein n=1 Tax=Eutreptiella gymnastica TaxID=73025 RepID=A0A7S1NM63_9EUGL|mmetsp:Transcript_57501/g.102721  ORF Transcript_57501/g.102721 Transcript_57501/m.102721 type:complete len:117 (+) Transcript_57501:359-709(+)
MDERRSQVVLLWKQASLQVRLLIEQVGLVCLPFIAFAGAFRPPSPILPTIVIIVTAQAHRPSWDPAVLPSVCLSRTVLHLLCAGFLMGFAKSSLAPPGVHGYMSREQGFFFRSADP